MSYLLQASKRDSSLGVLAERAGRWWPHQREVICRAAPHLRRLLAEKEKHGPQAGQESVQGWKCDSHGKGNKENIDLPFGQT